MDNLTKQSIIANFNKIEAIKTNSTFTKFFFVDNKGENVFLNSPLEKIEFGFLYKESNNTISFAVKASDENAIILTVPKNGELKIDKKSKINNYFLEYLLTNAIKPATKTTRKTNRNIDSTKSTKKVTA